MSHLARSPLTILVLTTRRSNRPGRRGPQATRHDQGRDVQQDRGRDVCAPSASVARPDPGANFGRGRRRGRRHVIRHRSLPATGATPRRSPGRRRSDRGPATRRARIAGPSTLLRPQRTSRNTCRQIAEPSRNQNPRAQAPPQPLPERLRRPRPTVRRSDAIKGLPEGGGARRSPR